MVPTKKMGGRLHLVARPQWTIEPGELRCRVREEGRGRVAKRLAISRDELDAVLRGRRYLRPEQVVALRTGAPLMDAVVHWRRAERSAA